MFVRCYFFILGVDDVDRGSICIGYFEVRLFDFVFRFIFYGCVNNICFR